MTSIIKAKSLLVISGLFFVFYSSGQTLDQAIKLTKNEEFEKADKTFRSLIISQPANGLYYFYQGENFLDWGKTDSAKAVYQRGININATNALNYVGLGKVQWYTGDSKDAIDNFYKAKVISKSKDAIVLDKIAEAYINAPSKDIKTAIDLLNQAMIIDPNNVDIAIDMGDAYLAQNDGSNAVTYYEKATTINPKSALGTLRLGQLYERARNYDLSYQYFQKATQIDSTFAPAYREKAEMLHAAGRNDEAIAQYKKYLQLNDAINARIRYASFLFVAKKYPDAISELQKIMAQDTTNAILFRLLGYAQYETGNYKDGIMNMNKFFAKAAQSNVKVLASDYAYQGRLLSKTGQDSLAIEKLKQALQKDTSSDVGEIYSQIGNIYFKNGNYPMATQYFQVRSHLPQPTVNDYNALGRAAYSCNQFQKADSAFAIITKYMPDLPLGYLWRARCNSSIDSLATLGLAVPFYQQYIQKVGADTIRNKADLSEAYDYLGYYYFLKKDKDNADNYYKREQNIDPNDPKPKQYFESLKAPKQPMKKEGTK
jgi:tetratricopeptide (TPR) repeat protein